MKRYEVYQGQVLEDPHGVFVRLADVKDAVDPLIDAARIIDLHGATISRLKELRKALAHLDKRNVP